MRQRYLDLIAREQARAHGARPRRPPSPSCARPSPTTATSRSRRRCCRPCTAGHPLARSSRTRNAFDTELFLRIAPELFLKRAVVGGIERVFEINRNFRNEGADSTHSPEFAMLEAYQAYGDYNQMADLTQELIQNAAIAVAGSHVVTWADGTEYDLGGEWDRISMYESLSAASGVEITPQTPLAELAAARRRARHRGQHPHPRQVRRGAVGALRQGRPRCARPSSWTSRSTPARSCATTARSPGVVEKWDLYIRGFELATGYSELVDPVIQRERFVEQATLAARGRPRGDAARRGVPARARARHAADRAAWAWASTAC